MITLDSLDLKSISDNDLGELLINAKKAYYTSGKPIMDDHTYDTLEDILRQKNPYHRIFSKVGNPNFNTGFDKKHHAFTLGSQNKVNSLPDLIHYFELKKIPKDTLFIVQPKCDGLSLEIEYKNGHLIDAITRGDGEIGDIITQNVVKMKNFVPHPALSLSNGFTGSIRCEIVVTKKDFEKLNQISDEKYSNPRNAASGLSQRLDSKYADFCTLFAVDIFCPSINFSGEKDQIEFLKKLNINTVDTYYCSDFDQIESIFKKFQKDRQIYPFDIDGLVVKIDDLKLQKLLGSKNNRPKYQVAYKFPADSSQSRVVAIDWQTGPLGTITPIAQIDPISVSGATITFISLSNFDQIKELNLNIGDIVEVSRRGDVIPHIERVITKTNPGIASPPKICPQCKATIVVDNKFIRCPNTFSCPSQTLGQLNLFCKVLDIKGISTKTIAKLNQSGVLNYPGDFYNLKISDIAPLENLGEKSAKNIIHQIQQKRHLDLLSIFHSASIPNFSKARIKQLIDAGFNTPDKLLNLTIPQIENLSGIKITLAQKIYDGIQLRKKNVTSVLSKITLKSSHTSQKLKDQTFCITGELTHPRKEIEKLIGDNGGKVLTSVTKNTDFLITNETNSNSSKFQAAKKLNIKVITEKKLFDLLT